MAPIKPFVFISCGQSSSHEKKLGLDIKKAIEELTTFEAYFAEDQSSANGLVANILERLYHCAGFVVVMHPRGEVKDDHDHPHVHPYGLNRKSRSSLSFGTVFGRTQRSRSPHTSIGASSVRESGA
jgi:hypothetical protein